MPNSHIDRPNINPGMSLNTLRLLKNLLDSQTISLGASRDEVLAVLDARDELNQAIAEAQKTHCAICGVPRTLTDWTQVGDRSWCREHRETPEARKAIADRDTQSG